MVVPTPASAAGSHKGGDDQIRIELVESSPAGEETKDDREKASDGQEVKKPEGDVEEPEGDIEKPEGEAEKPEGEAETIEGSSGKKESPSNTEEFAKLFGDDSDFDEESVDEEKKAENEKIEDAWNLFLSENPNCDPEKFAYVKGQIVLIDDVADVAEVEMTPIPPPSKSITLRDDHFRPHKSFELPSSDEF